PPVAGPTDAVRAANDGKLARAGIVFPRRQLPVHGLQGSRADMNEHFAVTGRRLGELFDPRQVPDLSQDGGTHSGNPTLGRDSGLLGRIRAENSTPVGESPARRRGICACGAPATDATREAEVKSCSKENRMRSFRAVRRALGVSLMVATAFFVGGMSAILGICGPFTDVAADAFCPFVLEIFYLGITTGTTATTYDPASNVSRLQMAAFLSRTVDGVLRRGSRRAALDQFWSTQNATVLGLTTVGGGAANVRSDGADLWVVNSGV